MLEATNLISIEFLMDCTWVGLIILGNHSSCHFPYALIAIWGYTLFSETAT